MGDGVTDETREVACELCREDDRVRFFDHPKHVRRGEPHRHAALQEAQGEIVCYLCDRDLMLPSHVTVMRKALEDADFATTRALHVRPGGRLHFGPKVDLAFPYQRRAILRGRALIPLSMAAHTIEQYRRLPDGWRTTPTGVYTDHYMWRQFLAQPECRFMTRDVVTILYLNRTFGVNLAWSVEERRRELASWYSIIIDAAKCREFCQWAEQYKRQLSMVYLSRLRLAGQLYPRFKRIPHRLIRLHARIIRENVVEIPNGLI